MENIGGIFVVLICGLIIAVFVAIMEFVWSTRRTAETDEVTFILLLLRAPAEVTAPPLPRPPGVRLSGDAVGVPERRFLQEKLPFPAAAASGGRWRWSVAPPVPPGPGGSSSRPARARHALQ